MAVIVPKKNLRATIGGGGVRTRKIVGICSVVVRLAQPGCARAET